jgi:hypothetical protein
MTETNVIGFDPVPRLGVTKLLEQTGLLLLGLYRLKRVETVTTVVEYIRAHNFWLGTQDLYADLNPIMSREQAEEVEGIFAGSLRRQGYTITAGHHDWA